MEIDPGQLTVPGSDGGTVTLLHMSWREARVPSIWKKLHEFIPILVSLYILPENRIITRMVIPLSETRSPLARLVLFMVCLSIAGTFIAGVHYAAVDLPQQQSVTAPTNSCRDLNGYLACAIGCINKYPVADHNDPNLLTQVKCKNACWDTYWI